MVTKADVSVVSKVGLPAPRKSGEYTFLKEKGETLKKNEALKVECSDVAEARKVQSRWRSYFKGEAHSRKEAPTEEGKVIVFLWREPK